MAKKKQPTFARVENKAMQAMRGQIHDIRMKTLNSLSGGATSSFMATRYPADYDVFALVCIDYEPARPKDALLVQMVNDKLKKHSLNKSEFIATAEDVKTLKVVFDLEQMIGREIAWVRGESFDQMIARKKCIPNMAKRICTSWLKIKPIEDFVLNTVKEPVLMRQGIRMDEAERQKKGWAQIYLASIDVEGKNGKQRKEKIGWAVSDYPMIEDRIFYPAIKAFKETCGLVFPEDSNCNHCFWKDPRQIRKNAETNRAVIEWAASMESKMNRWWKEGMSMKAILDMGLQLDFQFGGGPSCQSGFCSD